jgi:hypothetical protein
MHSMGFRPQSSRSLVILFPAASFKVPATVYDRHSQAGPVGSVSISFKNAHLFLNTSFMLDLV